MIYLFNRLKAVILNIDFLIIAQPLNRVIMASLVFIFKSN